VLAWALEQRADVRLGARVSRALGRFWSNLRPREAQRWLNLAHAELADGSDPPLAAHLSLSLGAMLPHGGFERIEASERALRECRLAAAPRALCRALSAYAEQLAPLGRASRVMCRILDLGGDLESARTHARDVIDLLQSDRTRSFGRTRSSVCR